MEYGLYCQILLMGYSGTEALELSDYIRGLNRPDLNYDILKAMGCKDKATLSDLDILMKRDCFVIRIFKNLIRWIKNKYTLKNNGEKE